MSIKSGQVQALGFEVEFLENRRDFKVKQVKDKMEFELVGLTYFFHLVRDYLMEEELVVSMISDTLKKVEASEYPIPARIEMQIQQHFGSHKRTKKDS